MLSTHVKNQEENYLGQLEQMLVQRIRSTDASLALRSNRSRGVDLSEFSREINEELGRIESLVEEYDQE